jgi:hypothetical protein
MDDGGNLRRLLAVLICAHHTVFRDPTGSETGVGDLWEVQPVRYASKALPGIHFRYTCFPFPMFHIRGILDLNTGIEVCCRTVLDSGTTQVTEYIYSVES